MKTNDPMQIVVLPDGFVFVGNHDRKNKIIRNCRNVRTWGVDKGIGQLAIHGPTEKTELDVLGTMEYYPTPIVCFEVSHTLLDWDGPEDSEFTGHHIFIAQRSFVFVGEATGPDRDSVITLVNGGMLRDFGTEGKGVGPIALDGPVAGATVITPVGTAYLPTQTLLFKVLSRHTLMD